MAATSAPRISSHLALSLARALAVHQYQADQSQTDRQIIARLWDVLQDPHLNRVLGISGSWQIGRSRRTA
jgi:hypothetical protein